MKILVTLILLTLAFSAQEQTYSEPVSGRMIQLSTAIYEITKADQVDNLCPDCYPGFTLYRQVLGNQILAIVGWDDELESVIVVFRGSSNLANWLTDANIIKTSYSEGSKNCRKCKVHKGFYNSHKRLVDKRLNEIINEAIKAHPNYGIIFTGHSLGGAVANLAAVNIRQQYPELDIQIYTFGQPRVGNQNYANYVDKQVPANFRVVHKKDIVPHKPASIAFFQHSGNEYWYKDGMTGAFIACKGESNDCSNSVGSRTLSYSTKDHSSKNYIQLLQKVNPSVTFTVNPNEPLDEETIVEENKAQLDENIQVEQSDLFDGQEDNQDL